MIKDVASELIPLSKPERLCVFDGMFLIPYVLSPRPEFDGMLVHVSGTATASAPLADTIVKPTIAAPAGALMLIRDVEVYREDKDDMHKTGKIKRRSWETCKGSEAAPSSLAFGF